MTWQRRTGKRCCGIDNFTYHLLLGNLTLELWLLTYYFLLFCTFRLKDLDTFFKLLFTNFKYTNQLKNTNWLIALYIRTGRAFTFLSIFFREEVEQVLTILFFLYVINRDAVIFFFFSVYFFLCCRWIEDTINSSIFIQDHFTKNNMGLPEYRQIKTHPVWLAKVLCLSKIHIFKYKLIRLFLMHGPRI